MTEYLASPIGFTSLAILASTLGALALAIRPDFVNRHAALFSLAAAGLLIAFVLLDLVPHALEGGAVAALFLLGGYFAGLITSLLTRHDANQTLDVRAARSGVALAGIGLHAFLDGVVFAVALSASANAGLLAALALALHKVPVSALTFGLLRTARFSVSRAVLLSVFSSGVMAGIGVFTAQPLMDAVGASGLSALFALSAGLLLFVATGPLLSAGAKLPAGRAIATLGAGVAVALLVVYVVPHSGHSHDAHAGHDHGPDEPHPEPRRFR